MFSPCILKKLCIFTFVVLMIILCISRDRLGYAAVTNLSGLIQWCFFLIYTGLLSIQTTFWGYCLISGDSGIKAALIGSSGPTWGLHIHCLSIVVTRAMFVHISLVRAGHVAHRPARGQEVWSYIGRRNVMQDLASRGIASATYCMKNVDFIL